MTNLSELKQLHDRDFNLWLQEMAIAIKNRDISTMEKHLQFFLVKTREARTKYETD